MLNTNLVNSICKYLIDDDIIRLHKITKFYPKLKIWRNSRKLLKSSIFDNIIYSLENLTINHVLIYKFGEYYIGNKKYKLGWEIKKKLVEKIKKKTIFIVEIEESSFYGESHYSYNININFCMKTSNILITFDNIESLECSTSHNNKCLLNINWLKIKEKIMKNERFCKKIEVESGDETRPIHKFISFKNDYFIIGDLEFIVTGRISISLYIKISENKKFICDLLDIFNYLKNGEISFVNA
jgi:hypothetical protein